MVEIGGYRLLRRLGAGGMGVVHEALDADGRRVAIKVLHPQISVDPTARDRLRREVALLHRVRDDAVARVLDAEADGVDAFIVTELVAGITLDEHVRSHGPLDAAQLTRLGHGLHDGLSAIHAAGIVHRDLKPGNVMLSPTGPVIIDFGIAQVADDVRLTQTGMVTGTPGYLAPEVLEGADPGSVGDWWAWAAVLVLAATGHAPFGGGPMVAVLARVSAGQVDTSGMEAETARVLTAALDPEPGRRPPPEGVLAVLDGARRADEVIPAPPVHAPQVWPPPQGQLPVPATAVLGGQVPPTLVAPGLDASPVVPAPPAARVPSYPPGAHPGPVVTPWAPGDTPAPVPAWARPLPRFRLLVGLVGLATAGIAGVAPGPWLLALVVLLVMLGAAGHGRRRLRHARLRRGLRRSDHTWAVLAAPWDVVVAAVLALPGLLVGGVVGGAGVWLVHETDPAGHAPLLWTVAVVAGGCAWFVPSSRDARDGARLALRGARHEGRVAVLLVALAALALFVAWYAAAPGGVPQWWPLPVAGWWMG